MSRKIGFPFLAWGDSLKIFSRSSCILFFAALLAHEAIGQDPKASCPAQNANARCTEEKIQHPKETIVVTGTFEPLRIENVDRSLSIFETQESPFLYRNWTDYLQTDPSLDLRQRAPDGVQGDLSIRGSTVGQTLVLLNGLRMNDAQTSHHNLDVPVPLESLDRIEVFRGAGSTLYGSDAMAGAVNFVTSPAEYSDLRAGTSVGNFGTNTQSLSGDFVSQKFDEELNLARDFSSGFRPDRDYRNVSVFSTTGVQSAAGRTLLMLGFGDKAFGADQFYGDFNSWERTKSWFAGMKQDLGTKTEFDFGYRRHTDEFILLRDNPSVYENNHIDESWQTALREKQPLGQNATLFFGGEGFHESVNSNNLGMHSRNRGAVYVDYDVRAWRRFSLSLGAREEILSGTHGEFSPTLAGGVWLKQGLKLKGSVSRAFRLPTYTDLDYHDPANIGNPTLQPETAWSYEGGLVWDRGGHYRAEVTLFERRDRNVIDYVQRDCAALSPSEIPSGTACSAATVWHAENIQNLNFTGVEAALELRLPRHQRVEFAYTGLHGAQATLGGLQSRYVFNYPVQDATALWQGNLPLKLIARTRIGIVSRFERDPYALWDAALAREFNHVAAHLGFSNLSNTRYEEIQGVVMPGRSVLFGLDIFVIGRKK